MELNTQGKLVNQFTRPLVVAVSSYALSRIMNSGNGDSVEIPLVGDIDLHTYFGVLGGASALTTETMKNWVIPKIQGSEEAKRISSVLLGPALHAAANDLFTGFMYPSIRRKVGDARILGIAAGSELGSAYVYDNFINKSMMN